MPTVITNNPISKLFVFMKGGALAWFLSVFVFIDWARLIIVIHGTGTSRQSRGGWPMTEVSK